MSINNVNDYEVAALVTIGLNGNVVINCPECQETWAVSIRLAASPFWEVFVGSALLISLNHFQEEHVQLRRRD